MLAVTGSNGFLGSYIVPRLLLPARRLLRNADHSTDLSLDVVGNLQNEADIDRLIRDTNTLVHIAWGIGPRHLASRISNEVESDVISSERLFRKFADVNPDGHIVFFSTGGSIYRDVGSKNPFSENAPVEPLSLYGIRKLAVEKYLSGLCRDSNLRATILRIGNPYGTLLTLDRGQGLIGTAYSCILSDRTLHIFDSFDTVRDYIHLDDLVRLVRIIIAKPPERGQARIYNAGTNTGTTIRDLLSFIEISAKTKLMVNATDSSTLPATFSILDCNLALTKLGWSSAVSLEDGLAEMWRTVRKSRAEY